MTRTTSSPHADVLRLGCAVTGLHWFAAGTTLIVLDGSVQLEPPSRSEAAARYALSAGHVHVVETSGWWRLHGSGHSGAHLRVVLPVRCVQPRAWRVMWHRLAGWAQLRSVSRS